MISEYRNLLQLVLIEFAMEVKQVTWTYLQSLCVKFQDTQESSKFSSFVW